MFQSEIILFFQKWASPVLTYLMQGFTAVGYPALLIVILAIILFGIDFKKGFALLQIILWTAALTAFFKNLFALPRPYMVDNRVQLLDGHILELEVPFRAKGAASFWGALPKEVIDYYRPQSIPYGFPSGHTSMATTMWASLYLLFKRPWVKYLSLTMILMVPFSRIFLGIHFLADVIGGYFLGFLVLAIAYVTVLRPRALSGYLARIQYAFFTTHLLFFLFLVFSPFLLLVLLPPEQYELAATILGINLGFLALSQGGLPNSQAPFHKRVLRVLLAFAIFILSEWLLSWLFSFGKAAEFWGGKSSMALLQNFLFVWGSVKLGQVLGLFEKNTACN
ncbi:MAG: phosphatase PAP2 family protein [Bacteroidota bacterium]